MSTTISLELERVDDKTVSWKVKADTNLYRLEAAVWLNNYNAPVFLFPAAVTNSTGSGGVLTLQWAGTSVPCRASATGRPKQGGTVETANVAGTMAKNQTFLKLSDTTP